MTRREMIEAAVETIMGSMQYMNVSEDVIREQAELLSDKELENYLETVDILTKKVG